MVYPNLSREAAFALAVFFVPPLAVLAPFGMAVYLPVFGLIAAGVLWRKHRFDRIPRTPLFFVGLLGLWGGATLVWAPEPGQGAATLARIAGLAVAGVLGLGFAGQVESSRSRLIAWAAAAGLALGAALVAGDLATGNAVSGLLSVAKGGQPIPVEYKSQLSRGATTLALLLWPFSLIAWRGRNFLLALACLGTMLVLAIGDSLAVRLSLAVGLPTFALALAAPRWGFVILRVAVVAGVAVLPMAARALPEPPQSFNVLPWLPSSTHHRLVIWRYAGQRIGEHPLRGWGMEAARADPGGAEMLTIRDVDETGVVRREIVGARLPLHPHNAVLQWWLELGLPGALLLAGFLWWLIGRIGRNPALDRLGRASGAGALAAALAISEVSYGAWQSWWLGVLWLVAALCLMAGRAPAKDAS
ncbi:MAG: hypothetical protein Q7R40_12365 [Phaeospirillum sp.]|nr:hypothetical protein [Phaeospirillum sp.]